MHLFSVTHLSRQLNSASVILPLCSTSQGSPSSQSTQFTPFSASESAAMEAAFQALPSSDQAATLTKNEPPPVAPSLFSLSNALSSTKSKETDSSANSGSTQPEADEDEDILEREGLGSAELRGEVEADEMMEALELAEAQRVEAERAGENKSIEDLMEEEHRTGVSVGKDDLFEVDVKEMRVRNLHLKGGRGKSYS